MIGVVIRVCQNHSCHRCGAEGVATEVREEALPELLEDVLANLVDGVALAHQELAPKQNHKS